MDNLKMAWEISQTGPGILLLGSILTFIFKKIFEANPKWSKYEGWLMTAVKLSEKLKLDDHYEKGIIKAEKALKHVTNEYEKTYGKSPKKKLIREFEQGISIVHSKLEANFTLINPK